MAWRCADNKAICTIKFNITVYCAHAHSKDGEIGVRVAMMWHGFSLHIPNDMARLLNNSMYILDNCSLCSIGIQTCQTTRNPFPNPILILGNNLNSICDRRCL